MMDAELRFDPETDKEHEQLETVFKFLGSIKIEEESSTDKDSRVQPKGMKVTPGTPETDRDSQNPNL